MRYTKNQLRALNIFNAHNLATIGQSRLYIAYISGESGRMASYPSWHVVGIGFKTNPTRAWYTNGHMSFEVSCRANKIPALNEAIQWCYEKYGIPKDQWEKDPYGGYQINGTMQKAKAERR